MRIHRLLAATGIAAWLAPPTIADAQVAALELVVHVRSHFRCPESVSLFPEATEGSATAVRVSGDTLIAVTASHVVTQVGCEVRSIQVDFQGRSGGAEIVARHPGSLDLAVVRAVLPGQKLLVAPRLPRPVLDSFATLPGFNDDRAYVVGCPQSGTCYEPPMEVRMRLSFPPFLRLQVPVIEPGYSGGAVVTRTGALLGIVVAASGDAIEAVRWKEVASWLATEGVAYSHPEPVSPPPGRTSVIAGLSIGGRTAYDFEGHGIRAYVFVDQRLGNTSVWAGMLNINEGWDERCPRCAGTVTLLATRGMAAGGGLAFRTATVGYADQNSPILFEFRVGLLGVLVEGLVDQQVADSTDPASGSPVTQRLLTKRETNLGVLADGDVLVGLSRRFSFFLGARLVNYGQLSIPETKTLQRVFLLTGLGVRLR